MTADAGYAYGKVYGDLEERGIDPVIPAKAEPIRSAVPLRRFGYDAKHDILRCPRGKILRPGRPIEHGRFFYSKARDCSRCSLALLCLSKGRSNKAVVVSDDTPVVAFALPKELTKASVFETERDDAVEEVQRDSRIGSSVRGNIGIEERQDE